MATSPSAELRGDACCCCCSTPTYNVPLSAFCSTCLHRIGTRLGFHNPNLVMRVLSGTAQRDDTCNRCGELGVVALGLYTSTPGQPCVFLCAHHCGPRANHVRMNASRDAFFRVLDAEPLPRYTGRALTALNQHLYCPSCFTGIGVTSVQPFFQWRCGPCDKLQTAYQPFQEQMHNAVARAPAYPLPKGGRFYPRTPYEQRSGMLNVPYEML